MGVLYENDIFEVKTNQWKKTSETKLFSHSLMCISILKFYENSSQNEEFMVIFGCCSGSNSTVYNLIRLMLMQIKKNQRKNYARYVQ